MVVGFVASGLLLKAFCSASSVVESEVACLAENVLGFGL